MGRGRQKAKATKQARDMKYFSPATDLSALERELAGRRSARVQEDQYAGQGYSEESDEPDYSDYADKYADHDDDVEEDGPRRAG